MKKLHILIYIIISCLSGILQAQVGIGTVTPDPSSILDITANDKGLLIPRVSIDNITNTMLDGLNIAPEGLFVWNTNAATLGGSGIGFYVFTGSVWEKLVTTSNTSSIIFKASNSTNLSLPTGTLSTLILDTASVNVGGGVYNTTTGVYIIPEDGTYEISFEVNTTFSPVNTNLLLNCRLYLNGTHLVTKIRQQENNVSSAFGLTFSFSFVEEFQQSDEINLAVFPFGSNGISYFGGLNTAGRGTYLLIKKL
jgi:hypothetical protein